MQEIVERLAASDPAADIARKLLLPYLNHAATMFESGYATSDDIDASMRFGCGYPIGPLALIDAIPDSYQLVVCAAATLQLVSGSLRTGQRIDLPDAVQR